MKGNRKPSDKKNRSKTLSNGLRLRRSIDCFLLFKVRVLDVDWFWGTEWLPEYGLVYISNKVNALAQDQSPSGDVAVAA